MTKKICRFCNEKLEYTFADLGMSPLANSYLKLKEINKAESFYPLHVYVCKKCLLAQLEEFESPEGIFSDYAYFSSFSDTWLKHAENYVEKMISKYRLSHSTNVIEIASNDGYLLQYFKYRNIPVTGIEPAKNIAAEAIKKGIPTINEFFSKQFAEKFVLENRKADLLIANNVLAHVPNLNDFIKGIAIILDEKGIATIEVPHILKLMIENQFDTIYHEHFSYFSLITLVGIFDYFGLTIFDIEELDTHGGSLRLYIKHSNDVTKEVSENVELLIKKEKGYGLDKIQTYEAFNENIKKTKREILNFLIEAKESNKSIIAYGAPAKGNTLLNYCGVGKDFIVYTVDKSPHKQGLYLPGTHIPIYNPDKIKETKPDFIVILPWNLKDEIAEQLNYVKSWGGKLVTFIPKVEVF